MKLGSNVEHALLLLKVRFISDCLTYSGRKRNGRRRREIEKERRSRKRGKRRSKKKKKNNNNNNNTLSRKDASHWFAISIHFNSKFPSDELVPIVHSP